MKCTVFLLCLRVLKIVCGVAATAALLFGGLLIVITITEYRPQPQEPALKNVDEGMYQSGALDPAQPLDILSWNIGYCGLGAPQSFFMDGGSMVRPPHKEAVEENLKGIIQTLKQNPVHIYLLQEVDQKSHRSYYINQPEAISSALELPFAYTYNYKAFFVPYPIPPLGKVASGLGTFTRFVPTESIRIALPVPFTWPVRTVNLKRCMLVSRFPLMSGKQLVTVNLHLEAYDDGAGKIAQTQALLNFIRAEYDAGNYVIAGGDFNQTLPGMKERYPLNSDLWTPGIIEPDILPEGWQFAVDGDTPSCRLTNASYTPALTDDAIRKNWSYYVIDGFILSPNITVQSVKTLDESFRYADHNPVKLRILLNP